MVSIASVTKNMRLRMEVAKNWMSGFYCQGDPECREEKVTLIGKKPVEECQV